jgi:arabinogalactan endo-1,4-beta-galactosidase
VAYSSSKWSAVNIQQKLKKMNRTILVTFLWCLLAIFFAGCNAAKPGSKRKPFAKGADIGWLQQMEATGYKFYNDDGKEEDCLKILKDHGINTVRLRTWVNPSDNRASGHNSKDETVAMAVRAQKSGMSIMINFHYSDSWADPGKQKNLPPGRVMIFPSC